MQDKYNLKLNDKSIPDDPNVVADGFENIKRLVVVKLK